VSVDWKQRAIEQWTADPCGPDVHGIEALMAARREYAPWMASQLGYTESRGLDVLDVGCGQGIDVCEFALAGARVSGIDLTPRHVALAREHVREAGVTANVVEGDVERLPFEDASFDRATSNGVLHHTPDIGRALREIVRVLRPGGSAVVIVYNRRSWHYWLHLFLWRGILRGLLLRERSMSSLMSADVEESSIGARPLVRAYSRREMRTLLEEAGFREVTTWVSPFNPDDSPLLRPLPRSLPLGAGWYIVARGVAPADGEQGGQPLAAARAAGTD
jgi:ubiquinone/menaquinone biosynthesis C-methylase UbiE